MAAGLALVAMLAFAAEPVDNAVSAFAKFKTEYNREYQSREIEEKRFSAFRRNLDVIASINADPTTTHIAGVGPFADLTPEEFLETYTSPAPPQPLEWNQGKTYLGQHRASPTEILPASIDWVAKGAVTAVKKQRCGNCWTFSACGSLEGAHQIATGVLTNYSEQEFVDCVDDGCQGGWNFNALKFAVDHPVCTLEAFPCLGWNNISGHNCSLWESSPCSKKENGALAKGAVAGWKSVGGAKWVETTEKDLESALQIGPVSINMFAGGPMGHYKGGIMSYSNCSQGTNHGVLAVGYGTCEPGASTGPCANVTKTMDYWKVKNSWGTSYGVDGYFYLARGVYRAGCGPAGILLTNPSYPIVAK